MPAFTSRRIASLQQSAIRHMTLACERVQGINLGQGLCDMPMLPAIHEAASLAMTKGHNQYAQAAGVLELRKQMARKLERDNGITANPETEIVVTAGATGAFNCTIHALLDPGDAIVLFEPFYGYHAHAASIAGIKTNFVTLSAPDFKIDEQALRQAITPDVRAIVACTPSNPGGRMLDKDELHTIAKIAHEFDLWVITDEIYEYIRYDGRAHTSPATVADLWKRTVTIMGLSKTFSMTGWRLDYAVAPPDVARGIALVSDMMYICAPTPLQHGAIAGFSAPQHFFDALQTEYQRKRDRICHALTDAGLKPFVPQGAYYVLADIARLGFATSHEAAMALLDATGVAAVPGSAFCVSDAGERLLRFCFAKDDALLDEACRRLRTFR